MAQKISVVSFNETAPKRKRVAAYARVSSGKDAVLHSLSSQVSYYNDLIQKHPDWEFCEAKQQAKNFGHRKRTFLCRGVVRR